MRKFIATTIIEYINEATVQTDKYYDIADEFYEKMINELNENNFINQKDGNILFKASEINLNYSDLLIIFTNYDTTKTKPTFGDNTFKGGYSFGTYKHYKVIVINNLKADKIPSRGIFKSSFIHEFIHYLDFKRSNGYKPNFNDKTTISDYYNSPTEYNAYYQEAATYIANLFKDQSILAKFKEKYKDFESFYKWMVENVLDKDYIKNLNVKNILKIKKRIYNIYSEFLEND